MGFEIEIPDAIPPATGQLNNRAIAASVQSNTISHLWAEARHFFSRADAQEYCWLWLRNGDGRVHAIRLRAAFRYNELTPKTLRKAIAGGYFHDSRALGLGHRVLPNAPVVPIPRWSVSWGHPLQERIRSFAANLDSEVLGVLGWLEEPGTFMGSAENYNRLAALPNPRRHHRLQALMRFPGLVSGLLLSMDPQPDMFGQNDCDMVQETHPVDPLLDAVLEAIDHGRDLIGALAARFDISRALVRSPLLRDRWQRVQVSRGLLRFLDALPAHARPKNPSEVESRISCLHALPVRRRGDEDTCILAKAFAQGWTQTWENLEARVPGNLQQALRDTADFLRAALRSAALPRGLRGLDEHGLGLAWLARRGVLSLLNASLRWHAQPMIPMEVDNALQETVTALIGTLQTEHDGIATELCNRHALIAEGEIMHHCVADYWDECVFNGTRIFHLTDKEGKAATAMYELLVPGSMPRFGLEQLRGPCNQAPTQGATQLAARVLNALNGDALRERVFDIHEVAIEQRERHAACLESGKPRTTRALDKQSQQELTQVLTWCQTHHDLLIRSPSLYSGAIAGFGYARGPHLIEQFEIGDLLQLIREPENPHDPRAVRIDWDGHKLGYIPREENRVIARHLDAGGALNANICQIRGESSQWGAVQIEVWPKGPHE